MIVPVDVAFRCRRCGEVEVVELTVGVTDDEVRDWQRFWICVPCFLCSPRRVPAATEESERKAIVAAKNAGNRGGDRGNQHTGGKPAKLPTCQTRAELAKAAGVAEKMLPICNILPTRESVASEATDRLKSVKKLTVLPARESVASEAEKTCKIFHVLPNRESHVRTDAVPKAAVNEKEVDND